MALPFAIMHSRLAIADLVLRLSLTGMMRKKARCWLYTTFVKR